MAAVAGRGRGWRRGLRVWEQEGESLSRSRPDGGGGDQDQTGGGEAEDGGGADDAAAAADGPEGESGVEGEHGAGGAAAGGGGCGSAAVFHMDTSSAFATNMRALMLAVTRAVAGGGRGLAVAGGWSFLRHRGCPQGAPPGPRRACARARFRRSAGHVATRAVSRRTRPAGPGALAHAVRWRGAPARTSLTARARLHGRRARETAPGPAACA